MIFLKASGRLDFMVGHHIQLCDCFVDQLELMFSLLNRMLHFCLFDFSVSPCVELVIGIGIRTAMRIHQL